MTFETLKNFSSPKECLVNVLDEAEAICVGVGAGMGAADGFTYVGERFEKTFPDFIKAYHFLDMFQASVYPFEDIQEYWAFFSRFVALNYLDQPLGPSFVRLKKILEGKNYHIITSNADNAFEKADFDPHRVFDVQGKYNLIQCRKGCHPKRYPVNELMRKMVQETKNRKVPLSLVPRCPKCGGEMELNRRNHVDWMVEDQAFKKERERFETFLQENSSKKLLLLELGCGYMAPQVIKHPFWKWCEQWENSLYVTVNLKNYKIPSAIRSRTIWLKEDIATLLKEVSED